MDPGEVAGLRILKYPHPALRAENEEIEVFDDDVKKLAKDMFKVRGVHAAGCFGPLAARVVVWWAHVCADCGGGGSGGGGVGVYHVFC